MKKIYNTPSTIVLQIKTGHLLTDSLGVKSGKITDSENILSRRRNSVWDDDEDF